MIVDCFMFFNEKELLELRVSMMKNHVDKFLIADSNRTHSGIKKEFTCKKIIKELGLPEEKIEVIEVDIPEEELLEPNIYDIHHATEAHSIDSVKTWTRERMQRDSFSSYVQNFPDDTVFILSDLDELVKPEAINFYAECAKNYNLIIKVPLVLLEGEATKRVCRSDGSYVSWEHSLLFCTKHYMSNGTFTEIRGSHDEFKSSWITQDNVKLQDMGWHFTWMGGAARKKLKAAAYLHHSNMQVVDNITQESLSEIGCQSVYNLITKPYPLRNLPKEIFELPNVFEFLLPNLILEEVKAIRKEET